MFIRHQRTVNSRLFTVIVETILRHCDFILVGLDKLVKLDYFLLLVVHFELVIELSQHLLLAVKARHLFSQRCAEHLVYHFSHGLLILSRSLLL